MSRVLLAKRDVELLLDAYDTDPVAALSVALDVLGVHGATWDRRIDALDVDAVVAQRLKDHDVATLDALVAQLVETRTVTRRS